MALKGKKWGLIKRVEDKNRSCISCKKSDIGVKVYRKYTHYFFIPFYGVGDKEVVAKCNHCGVTQEVEKYDSIKEKSKTPFYFYSGIVLIISIFSFVIINRQLEKKEFEKYFKAPQVNDVYLLNNNKTKHPYSFIKIKKLTEDSIYVLSSHLSYYKKVSEMSDNDYFMLDKPYAMPRRLILKIYHDDGIAGIFRGYESKSTFSKEK